MPMATKTFLVIKTTALAAVFYFFFNGLPLAPTAAEQKGSFTGTTKLTRQGDKYVVTIPGVPWTLQFAAGELEPIESRVEHGYSYFYLVHKNLVQFTKMPAKTTPEEILQLGREMAQARDKLQNVSFWVDRSEKCKNDPRIGRDKVFAENKLKWPQMQIPRLWQSGDMYVAEFTVPSGKVEGREALWHNIYANWVKDGVWIDIHLSKAMYEEKDRRLFLDFLNSVKFVPAGK